MDTKYYLDQIVELFKEEHKENLLLAIHKELPK
jgi:hypothetical protein